MLPSFPPSELFLHSSSGVTAVERFNMIHFRPAAAKKFVEDGISSIAGKFTLLRR